MTFDSLKNKLQQLNTDIRMKYWPRLVADLEIKTPRSLFFRALFLGLILSVPWQCSRIMHNAYFTVQAKAVVEHDLPLITPGYDSGSVTKMPNPKARRALPAPLEAKVQAEVNPAEAITEASATSTQLAPNHDAAVIHREAPVYPSGALRKQLSGTVMLRVIIDANGKPDSIKVERSSGTWSLDRAARKAVSKWQFSPKIENGIAVNSELLIPVDFKAE